MLYSPQSYPTTLLFDYAPTPPLRTPPLRPASATPPPSPAAILSSLLTTQSHALDAPHTALTTVTLNTDTDVTTDSGTGTGTDTGTDAWHPTPPI